MLIKFKIELSSHIIDFPYSLDLKRRLEMLLIDSIQALNYQDEWTITFQLSPHNVFWEKNISEICIGVYKKGINYTQDKEKVFTIIIPIPNREMMAWGLEKKKYIQRPLIETSNFILLKVDAKSYNSLEDYIAYCFQAGILLLLNNGITVNKKRYKLNKT